MVTDASITNSIEQLCARPAFITDIQSFLDDPDDRKSMVYWLSEFAPKGSISTVDDIIAAVQQAVAHIDHLINDQINTIIHDRHFQALEASWRGLWQLACEADGVRNIKVKVLDISWKEASRDISRSLEFDQSQLFKKIYSDEYGTPGGEPYGVLIGDYEITHKPSASHQYDDIATLEGLSQIAAAAFSPFVAAASPTLFGLNDFTTLAYPLNLQNIFSQSEYTKWRSFRSKPEAQFAGLVLPRILMRLPYRKSAGSYRGLYFREQAGSDKSQGYCWGNAAYAFASILIREFANVGWFGHIRGVPRNQIGGGLVTTLPCDGFTAENDEVIYKPVTDVIISDVKERELSDFGFIPLCQCYDTPFAAFYSNQSLRKNERIGNSEEMVNARLSAMLQHVLCGARIAHYIKVIIRDKVGSFISAEECEDYLRDWLFKYTTGREDLDWEEQAKYPLREAAVEVKNHPEKPGSYLCIIQLRPHYQLDHMVSELELITELAQSA
ncbi:MAG: type VI secretion system contractile sheath large subunit [Gammaproteobacteria bacterium]|nr:type VI secretion system contractile sheath large subunit [Gammaproteobacteria bacterium]